MTKAEYFSRADSHTVTDVLSEAFSRTLPCTEDAPFQLLTPDRVDEMGFPLAELQEVQWEVYPGLTGTQTLLKKTEISTAECDECGGEGWKDQYGDTLCRHCGLVLNSSPELVPMDHYSGTHSGISGRNGYYVYFEATGGKPALNSNLPPSSSGENQRGPEPDVQ